ncbi:MAG: hypothetical protein ACKPEY_18070, partial [Planctomycetota bacterium]
MNKQPQSETAIAQALSAKLRELLEQVAWLRRVRVVKGDGKGAVGHNFQVILSLASGVGIKLFVECRRELRPSDFRLWVDKHQTSAGRKTEPVRVLGLPSVSPRIAQLCEEHGWSWFDLAGNHRLDVPGLLRLERTGNESVHRRPRPTANLSTPEAARVVRALLLPNHVGMQWTQRKLQRECHPAVSLGLVNKVIRYLRDEALVEVGDDNGVGPREPLKLLYAWRDAYRFQRHERRAYFTLLQGKKLQEALGKLGTRASDAAAYAAYSAAEFQAPHVRQPKTWLYVRESTLAQFEELLEATEVDSGENLVVLVPNDDGVFYALDIGVSEYAPLRCTNIVQTYVDLWHCGGRGQE